MILVYHPASILCCICCFQQTTRHLWHAPDQHPGMKAKGNIEAPANLGVLWQRPSRKETMWGRPCCSIDIVSSNNRKYERKVVQGFMMELILFVPKYSFGVK